MSSSISFDGEKFFVDGVEYVPITRLSQAEALLRRWLHGCDDEDERTSNDTRAFLATAPSSGAAPTMPPELCTHPGINVDGDCTACRDRVALAFPVEFAKRMAEIDAGTWPPARAPFMVETYPSEGVATTTGRPASPPSPPVAPRPMGTRALNPGERCTNTKHGDAYGHAFADLDQQQWDGPLWRDAHRCPYVEPAASPPVADDDADHWALNPTVAMLTGNAASPPAWDPVAHMEAVKAREASPTLDAIHRESVGAVLDVYPNLPPPGTDVFGRVAASPPVCEPWCGTVWNTHDHGSYAVGLFFQNDERPPRCFCSRDCRDLGKPRHPVAP